jgi:hypothetical protein
MFRPGVIRQVAFLTRDIHKSMARWTEHLGVGPWFYADGSPIERSFYRGAPCPLRLRTALAASGDMQFELVETACDTPSMYCGWMGRSFDLEIQQHVAVWPANYDEHLNSALAYGYRTEQGGVTPWGRFVYLLHPSHPDLALEISELSPERGAFYRAIAEAAVNWDGRDPVRAFSAASAPHTRS